MLPLDVLSLFGKVLGYAVFLLVGMGFGSVLEAAGFGDSRKLSAQFYFRDMTVLKVMFTAIVTAMVLLYLGSALGWVDFSRIYINATVLWPQIVGGLVMGLGFIIGGYCPGTSLVGMATLKLDGLFFTGGVFAGVWLFGETVGNFMDFYQAGYTERLTLPELWRVDAGVVVVAVVLVAVAAFAAAGWAEKHFGAPAVTDPRRVWRRRIAAAVLIAGAATAMFLGQPSAAARWQRQAAREESALQKREVFVHPAELVELMHNPAVHLRMLDVRSEHDFNLFHLENARRASLAEIAAPYFPADLGPGKANPITVVYGNDETQAVQAYRLLRGHGLLNVYILEGGINRWLREFPLAADIAAPLGGGPDTLAFRFSRCVGEAVPSAAPAKESTAERFAATFPRRVKLQARKALKGGCG